MNGEKPGKWRRVGAGMYRLAGTPIEVSRRVGCADWEVRLVFPAENRHRHAYRAVVGKQYRTKAEAQYAALREAERVEGWAA